MGIQGLLPLLKSIMVPIHIKDLEGCSVAIDTYSWLHKGALSCSKEICKGQLTSKHIVYCMHRVNLLRHYGVKPVLVFDGGLLPMKSEQENKRGRARKESLARAIEHESNGNTTAAYECYQKAVDISPWMAYELIQVLKKENVYYVVAPYEADAQMTFLAVSKQVDAVLTEDSDLIAFGCPRIIYKMDKFGQGVEFRYSMLQQNKELDFTGFTKQMILEMCILSGCDYLQSLPGLGLKKAYALVKKFRSYDKVIKHLRYSTVSVSPGYEELFKKAILTFLHQRIYDPVVEDIVHLSDVPDNIDDDLDFLGPNIPQHIAKGIAIGELDPLTRMPFQKVKNNADLAVSGSFQRKHLKTEVKKLDLPVQKNLLTSYFCFASFEAKRKYRAPRTTEEVTAHTIDSPLASLLDSGYIGSPSPLEDNVEIGATIKAPHNLEPPNHGLYDQEDILGDKRSPEDPLLQQARSIHKSCTTLRKQHGSKSVSFLDDWEMRTEHNNVTARSCYFQHKSAGGIVSDKENEMSLAKYDVIKGGCENAAPLRECKSMSVESEANTRIKKRKTIIRSSYFQHKSATKEQGQDNRAEKCPVKDGISARICEDAIPETAFLREPFDSSIMRQKFSSVGCVLTGSMNCDDIGTNALLPIQSDCSSTYYNTDPNAKAEGKKFGSDICHLENYSDIAEKSMERFVSVISSFRCSSSSGSRVSGLRAPLKDVRNTCTSRSSVDADFSKFAYVPTEGKIFQPYRRG